MQLYGQLQNASIESLSSDPSQSVQGRIYYNTTSTRIMVDDGTLKRAIFRNDQNFIFGNNGTAANNVRINRSGNALLQLVLGSDTTAEGSLSVNVAQLSSRQENWTTGTAPAAGNAGRLYYATDVKLLYVDNGSAFVPVGGAGGSRSIEWIVSSPGNNFPSPTPSIDSAANEIFSFGSGLAQVMYATIRVPSTYAVGSQINLRVLFYSPDSTGTAFVHALGTLVRVGTDAFSSNTNAHLSTNTALTLGGGTVNIPQAVVCDLTDSAGKINSVAVSPGDLIMVELLRGTDTGVSDLAVLAYASEVTFQ